ncbi:hypothetical protein TVAG_252400 [Trichomonas vaginalis G3]|uniref:Uncharacterized protein n=1 Tax=Trichomonas vaginalis (strain ATCC PRA-98 / G3) TaxID=412133 RepID=A2DVY2_TRIV3|nr:protein deneddylation [Trichomonas vaginalis G3]EAY15427.1 hypothetical protein TVAG_252400 [Trichomonas vaginalis G3]KAI5499610.1 protein deneddylation [Trichomonas vaginalis G3]|eukprot:XP_001327650.1 hypothetical protein [Trichomonas vaginalis G3]
MEVFIHPQALLQIADHTTRSKYFSENIKYICGVIYGRQEGSDLELTSTIEINFIEEGYEIKVNPKTYEPLNNHHLKLYPEEIPLAWYSCQDLPESEISKINNAFAEIFKVYLRIHFKNEENPIDVFLLSENETWIPTSYSYKTEAPERIALIHLQSDGKAENRIEFTKTAFRVLDSHIDKILSYLENVKSGNKPFNCELVRKCATIAKWWKHSHMKKQPTRLVTAGELSYITGILAETYIELESKYKKNTH